MKSGAATGKEADLYLSIGRSIAGAEESQMFGKPCFKVNKKAFVSLFDDEMVFKLPADAHRKAMSLAGAQAFDPSKKGRPMKEWVTLPYAHRSHWDALAHAAFEYVKRSTES